MTGAILATISAGGAGAGTGGAPDAMAWSNPYGFTLVATQALTVAGIGAGAASIAATNSGGATLSYIHNGVSTLYTGAFAVSDGDTLAWSLLNLSSSTLTGTVAVSSGSSPVGTFTYVVRGNNNF